MEQEFQQRVTKQAMIAATTIANDLNMARSSMKEEENRVRESINEEKRNVTSAQQRIDYEYSQKVKEMEAAHQLFWQQQAEHEKTIKRQQLEMEQKKIEMQKEYDSAVRRREQNTVPVHATSSSSSSSSAAVQSFDIHTPRTSHVNTGSLSPDPFLTPPSSHHRQKVSLGSSSPQKPPPPPAQQPSIEILAIRSAYALKLEEEASRREFERIMLKNQIDDEREK
jgi:hypothetical protein